MTQTVAQFAARTLRAPFILRETERKMVQAAALSVTTAVRAEIASATHGTNRLSGVGRRGAKVGVGYDMKGSANPTALVRARGPLHLIESNTAAHPIRPRKRGKRVLANQASGFGPVASVANHPGTTGKHPFAKGVDRGLPAGIKAGQEVLHASIVSIVRG